MSASPYIDFHTHKSIYDGDKEVIEIISCHKEVSQESSTLHTLGYHPWWTDQIIEHSAIEILKNHVIHHASCLGIGECGLDKLRGAERAIQEAVFFEHILIANEIQCPLIIHCVRQYDALIQFRKYGTTPWVIHGFRRNQILAKSLLDSNIKLSVSPYYGMNSSFVNMLTFLPMDMFFIETDSEVRLNIKERYTLMAELKKINNFELRENIFKNVTDFFKWKNTNLIGSKEPSY